MQPASEEEIARALKAIDQAPRTDTGIIIPPHVAAEKEAARQQEMYGPTPNRKLRRLQAKHERRAAKRQARRTPVDPEEQKLIDEAHERMKGLSEKQLNAAAAMVREAADAPPALKEQIMREQAERHS